MSWTKEQKRAYNRAYMMQHRKKYKDKDREYQRAYYERNREKIRAYQRAYREKRLLELVSDERKPRQEASVGRKRKKKDLSLLFLRKQDRENFKWLCERMKNKRKKSEECGDASGCKES